MPPNEGGRVLVWRLAGAVLAAPVEQTIEVAAVADDGLADARSGRLELITPPGLTPAGTPRRAVIVRIAGEAAALAADDVEGILGYDRHEVVEVPRWLQSLPDRHVAGLIRLDDHRIAALLALDTLDRA